MTPTTTPVKAAAPAKKAAAKKTVAKKTAAAPKKSELTLTPLDLSDFLPKGTENKELDEFKLKVIDEAKKHSKAHHCGEYKSVLRNLGISEKAVEKANVTFTTLAGFEFNVQIEPKALAGKTADEQAQALLNALGDVSVGTGSGTASLKIPASSITSWEIQAKSGIQDPPTGYKWGRTSRRGRVIHLLPTNRGDWGYLTTGCSKSFSWSHHLPDNSGEPCARCLVLANRGFV